MTTIRTSYGITAKFEHNGEILRVKVVHVKGNRVAGVIMRNSELLIERDFDANDTASVLWFIDTCNLALSAFRKVTGFNDNNALGDLVSAIRGYLG